MIAVTEIKGFESDLNNFDRGVRENALAELNELSLAKKILINEPVEEHNLHCHTYYSYNGYNFSPTYIAWLAHRKGWFAAGVVDFDVLDGVNEFLAVANRFKVRGVCGIETRVFVPEMAEQEINSPGEPGIAYHMGVGFHSGNAPECAAAFLTDLKKQASSRTGRIVELVNQYLAPVVIDFVKDAASLTPGGNVTERHVCAAFRKKAETMFSDAQKRAEFWASKLGITIEEAFKVQADEVKLEALIRSKTMKKGGAGYINPDPKSFPTLKAMNDFVKACGAAPTVAWLNGESGGESAPGALLDLHIAQGAALLNIIPDRNWNFSDPDTRRKKVNELNRIIAAAVERDMPVIVGTEMNAPGQKLVDDFTSDALAPHLEKFIEGAAIAYAHTQLTPYDQGYLSSWAAKAFKTTADKNRFFAELGRKAVPGKIAEIKNLIANMSPDEILLSC
ncbi:MAG: hypothetical protein WC071_05635 [Victivallaceae bacterium]